MLRHLLFGRAIYPAYHALKRDGINKARSELAESEWLDADALATLQQEKLKRLLQFAELYVPYYAETIKQLGKRPELLASPDKFQEIPPLTKEIIRNEGSRLHADASGGTRSFPNSTSGSTGEPTRFLTDATSHAYRLADELRGKCRIGFRLGDREIALWGAQIDVRRSQRWRGRLHGFVTGHRLLSSFNLSTEDMDAYIATIQQFRPAFLTAYPSALEQFSEHCVSRGVPLDSVLQGVICSAETLMDHQRVLFEQVFGRGRIYNRYGSREVGAIAHECTAHHGLHVSADRLFVEIVDEYGRPCPPGVTGEVLVTDLNSYAMPFIRYRMGDLAAWSSNQICACGRRLPVLSSVSGRSMDVVKAPSGNAVGGTFFTMLLRSRGSIDRFQVVQDQHGDLVIRFVAQEEIPKEVREHFTCQIQKRLGDDLRVAYERTREISTSASGKRRLIISHYKPESTRQSEIVS